MTLETNTATYRDRTAHSKMILILRKLFPFLLSMMGVSTQKGNVSRGVWSCGYLCVVCDCVIVWSCGNQYLKIL